MTVLEQGEALDKKFFTENPAFKYRFRTPLPGEIEALHAGGKQIIDGRYWICVQCDGAVLRKPVIVPLHVPNAEAWINAIWVGLEAHEARAGKCAH